MTHKTEHTITVKEGKGAYAKIDFVLLYEGLKGLRYQPSPSVNQEPHHKATLKLIQVACVCAVRAHMPPEEAVHALRKRIVPTLEYVLKITSLDKTQCHSYNTTPRKMCVVWVIFNRNYPGTVVCAPVEYGGMKLSNVGYLQNQTQLEYWLKQLGTK